MLKARTDLSRALLAVACGAAVFALGVELARRWLPDWQSERLASPAAFAERFRELSRAAGIQLARGTPRVAFARPDKELDLEESVLDRLSPKQAAEVGAGLLVDVRQKGELLGPKPSRRELVVYFTALGHPLYLQFGATEEIVKGALRKEPAPPPELQERFARLLVRSGESLGPASQGGLQGAAGVNYPVRGSQPPQRIVASVLPGGTLLVLRQLVEPEGNSSGGTLETVGEVLLEAVPVLAGVLTALGLFFVLLGRRRIDLAAGAWLAAVLLVIAAVPTVVADPTWVGLLKVVGAAFLALWAFVVWSAGESYLRLAQPGLVASLDALRKGRLGPRGGGALVWGVACGAGLAGLRLAAQAVAARLPGAWPEGGSLRLPLFDVLTPFNDGVVLAGGVAIVLALAWRFVPSRWSAAAAGLVAGLAIPLVDLSPSSMQAVVNVAAAGLLVVLIRRAGLAAGLAAALSTCLLQAAAFSAFYVSWLPVSLAVSAATPAFLLALGFVGLGRPAEPELERLAQPAFMKRIEEERRLKYEMDLLARMQLGLLPAKLPAVTGWEIAARSLLATEAGGDLYDFLEDEEGFLWIAAGDVAGHGYSCAIVQSMTAAALTSLISAENTPAEVLRGIDRVIRRGSQRNFTSLALVRLDPRTGQALVSNAGHPFPLLLLGAAGAVEEIDLPGLPLGQGPARKYADLPFEIPPGSSLVFCSDGLFEGADWHDAPYGYERPRELLHSLGSRSAAEILEALFADWRRHLGDREHQDDTTVVVVRRH
jgi:hypothetical protein